MKIKFRIISVDPNEHSAVIRYFTDEITEDSIATEFFLDENTGEWKIKRTPDGFPTACRTDQNIAFFQVPMPVGQELTDYILSYAPVAWFDLQEKVKAPEVDTSMKALLDIQKKVVTAELKKVDAPPISNKTEHAIVSPEDIDRLIQEFTKNAK